MMTLTADITSHDSYRHEAFFYRGPEDFLAGTVPFVREGVAVGQPVMVAVPGARLDLLRSALGAAAGKVTFVDMTEVGHNPARIIPAWRQFVDEAAQDGQPVRGIGEPLWAGRRAAEVAECQLHEALLNMAVEPDTAFWLRCPYDGNALGSSLIAGAHSTHPILVEADDYQGSRTYGGLDHVSALFGGQLPDPPCQTRELVFGPPHLSAVRQLVAGAAADAGLAEERIADLVLAVHELAVNSTEHGGGQGSLRVWQEPDALVCEVRDRGHIKDPMVGRRSPSLDHDGGRGVWLVNQLCDLVQVRSSAQGSAIRVLSWT